MPENAHVGTSSFIWQITGAVLWTVVPLLLAVIWKIRKKEPVTSILAGAAAFLLFALILEKPVQNVLLFPAAMGLEDHAVSRFMGSHPFLLAYHQGGFKNYFSSSCKIPRQENCLSDY